MRYHVDSQARVRLISEICGQSDPLNQLLIDWGTAMTTPIQELIAEMTELREKENRETDRAIAKKHELALAEKQKQLDAMLREQVEISEEDRQSMRDYADGKQSPKQPKKVRRIE
jgi:hypothetical protein